MIHIAIVEDDVHDKARLKKCLKRYEEETQRRFEVTEFSDGEDIITEYMAKYDLILMDIEMTFMNGMSAARRIREMDPDVELIFITNMPQYAIQGYKVNALDYLLKPLSYFSFTETMKDTLSQLDERFFSCSRSYVVNLDYVEHYRGNDLTVNGDVLAMSRGRRNAFLDALNAHMNGEWG